jgi:phosphatidylinositol alpha-1,6-mannosyltransferase
MRPVLRYVIVGDGDERARLEALVGHHGLRDRVTFVGEVPGGDLPGYYAACDIFLLPNRIDDGDVEGFGIVFLEAAAAGKPTVGGRSGGVPEAVEDGTTGLLVSGTDVQELSAAIRRLATSATARDRMGRAGRARVLSGLTWERAADQVGELHRRLGAFA